MDTRCVTRSWNGFPLCSSGSSRVLRIPVRGMEVPLACPISLLMEPFDLISGTLDAEAERARIVNTLNGRTLDPTEAEFLCMVISTLNEL